MLIDTHCHLHDRQFFTNDQAEAILERARANGVEKIICIGTDPADSIAARDFAATHDNVFWTYGIHPEGAKEFFSSHSEHSKNASDSPIFYNTSCVVKNNTREYYLSDEKNPLAPIAIGEVGLDYHYGRADRDQQIKLFEQMLQLAVNHNLPLSLHVREAFDDFFAVIANFHNLTGVVHSFSDNKKNLRKILNSTNFYIGVNGLATYSTLPTPPLERTILETDAPFLTPSQFRGIINEPGYVKYVAIWLADKLGE